MIDENVKKFSDYFDKFGDPNDHKEAFTDRELMTLDTLYKAYQTDTLRETIAAIGSVIQKVKVDYTGDIDELINTINSNEKLDSAPVIHISNKNEIRDIDKLIKLKETYPDKEIIVSFHGEIAFIDNAISAAYMIEYYKSVINDSLSPLEKVTIAYDITKSFVYNDYKKDNTSNSREITKIVNTGNIVCVGYSKIFNAILNELGIGAVELSVEMKNEKEHAHHQRSIIYIKDDKYKIDSCFTCDATFDSASHEYYISVEDNKFKPLKTVQTEGYTKADTFSPYNNFLIPITSYRSRYPSSCNETIKVKNKDYDKDSTHDILYNNQSTNIQNALSDKEFVELLYTVRLAEGYSEKEIPKLIQEAFYISYDKPYSINAIESAINELKEKKSLT